ncbi:MAG: hypothetical protein KKD44_00645 [Proteobacteria bacterium]|nr:hypothetical protein [Pseudomonadota bacterium]
MKKIIYLFVFSFLLLSLSSVHADTAELMSQADGLSKSKSGSMDDYLAAANIYKQILETEPDNYDATWKCAKALRFYAYTAQKNSVDGWKKICAQIGKEGMTYAQKAIDMKPDQPDGYYYFALNVGIYADGVSILTALKEGLKDKTQTSFEKVLELDKNYDNSGAVLGMGRFWSVLPWPLAKKKKALEYYREFQSTEFFGKEPESFVYISELLIDLGGKKNKEEARQILSTFKTDSPFFTKWSNELQAKL